jgi:hypothetical protein
VAAYLALTVCVAGALKARGARPRGAESAASAAATASAAVARLVKLEFGAQLLVSLALLNEAVLLPKRNCPLADGSPYSCAATYFMAPHLCVALKWLTTQMPVRLIVLPEALRNAACAALALAHAAAAQPGGVTARHVAGVLGRAAAAAFFVPLLAALCHNRVFQRRHMPAGLDACPRVLAPAVAGIARWAERSAAALLPEPVIDFAAVVGIAAGVLTSITINGGLGRGMVDVTARVNTVTGVALCVSAAFKRHAGTATGFSLLQRRLLGRRAAGAAPGDNAGGITAAALAAQLAASVSEQDLVRVASAALHALYPAACAQAIATLHPAGDPRAGRIALLDAAAAEESERTALLGALPRPGAPPSHDTSVAFVCGRGARVADSRDWRERTRAFADWRGACEGGVEAAQFVTARLTAGGLPQGFLMLAFRAGTGFDSDDVASHDALRDFCEAVGAAVGVRRAADALARAERARTHRAPLHALASRGLPRRGSDGVLMSTTQARAAVEEAAEQDDTAAEDMLVDRYNAVTVIFAGTNTHRKLRCACCLLGVARCCVSDGVLACVTPHADVVGFNALCDGMSADASMALLDALWQRFDTLATAHGCYKVEARAMHRSAPQRACCPRDT